MSGTTVLIEEPTRPLSVVPSAEDKTAVANNLFQLIEKEYQKGNLTVTKDKYDALVRLRQDSGRLKSPPVHLESPSAPPPLYPPIFYKLALPKLTPNKNTRVRAKLPTPLTFKKIESVLITVLETLANLLDNLHLFSKMPFFPKQLLKLLKHTNRLWVLILVFLIRKTISQLLNVMRKEKKILGELSILKGNINSKLLEKPIDSDTGIFKRYEKVLKDLQFDKMMLGFELVGDVLDLAFNVIELYNFPVPEWIMTSLNFASMAMTVYRMNKDDEYKDDDISQDIN